MLCESSLGHLGASSGHESMEAVIVEVVYSKAFLRGWNLYKEIPPRVGNRKAEVGDDRDVWYWLRDGFLARQRAIWIVQWLQGRMYLTRTCTTLWSDSCELIRSKVDLWR